MDGAPKGPSPHFSALPESLGETSVLGTKGRSGGNGRGSSRALGASHVPARTWTLPRRAAPASKDSPEVVFQATHLVSNWESR